MSHSCSYSNPFFAEHVWENKWENNVRKIELWENMLEVNDTIET